MRKTKLIILPTRCLNTMGFLLLFLSCPVIGDWGRIRPDSEMSQWSILIERAGSCGLVRHPPGIKQASTPDGLMECKAPVENLQNNTLTQDTAVESGNGNKESESAIIPIPDIPIQESGVQRRSARSDRLRTGTERRLSERDLERKSFRREARSLSPRQTRRDERRAASLDRRNSARVDENVRRDDRGIARQRNIQQREVRVAERNDFRRSSQDRRVEARRLSVERRVRDTDGRVGENLRGDRRLSPVRREAEVGERREAPLRRIENVRSQRTTRELTRRERFSQFRNERRAGEERRTMRRLVRDERNEIRRNVETERSSRRASFDSVDMRQSRERSEGRNAHPERISRADSARINNAERRQPERRMERGENREERRSSERRRSPEREALVSRRRDSSEERRLAREGLGRRSAERAEERRVSHDERRIRTSDPSLHRMSATRSVERRSVQARRTERDVRGERRSAPNAATDRTDRMLRDTVDVSRRREDARKEASERSARRERSVDGARRSERRFEGNQIRRTETDLLRKEGVRVSVRRADKPREGGERREAERILARDTREKTARMERMLRYERVEPFTLKEKTESMEKYQRWEFLDGVKNWFGQKNEKEQWVANYGDLTATCLVGAAVYLLTTRQVKSV